MGARLVAEEGLLKGLTLPFGEGEEWVVGRDPDACQLLIEDPSASRRHFVCRVTPEGIIAENLSETNPLKVNQKEIPEPTLLHHGDTLQVGEGLYRFYLSDNPSIEGLSVSSPDEEEHETPSLFEDHPDASEEEALAEIHMDLTDTAPWMLKVVAGPNNGAQFSMMSNSSYLIGTDPSSCDIVFHDVSVSRQHARLSISKDNVITLEDLGSSNGTLAESQPVKGKTTIPPNTLISTGTTSFVIFDREGQRQTIISPLLPAIVKLLQDEQKKREEITPPPAPVEMPSAEKEEEKAPEPAPAPHHAFSQMGALVLIAVLSGIFLFVGMGAIFLFKQEKIEQKTYDIDKELSAAIDHYPSIRYSFNATSGRLVLIGHVLTAVEREQLLHDLSVFPFISNVDSNIVVDENIWQETNQIMAKNPNWKGVSVHSPIAGRFIITGYVSTRKQSEALSEYLNQNFPYIDLLEQKFVIEEDVLNKVGVMLKEKGFSVVTSKFNSGEVILTGDIPYGERPAMNTIADDIKKMEGVRDVKVYVTELPPSDTLVNITSQYQVTGSLAQGNGKISVVINGQIYGEGDSLDGKVISKITDSMIMLESGGVKYRIDYSQ